MCRPGRLDKLLYVDLPSANERAEIVRTMICRRKMPIPDTSLSAIETLVREKCDGYSGADLAALVREAAVCTLKKVLDDAQATLEMVDGGDLAVGLPEFEDALSNLGPSVSAAQRRKYEALRSKFAGLPVKASKPLDDSKDEEKVA